MNTKIMKKRKKYYRLFLAVKPQEVGVVNSSINVRNSGLKQMAVEATAAMSRIRLDPPGFWMQRTDGGWVGLRIHSS